MKVGFILYGSADTVSGGYLYDRKLIAALRSHGDEVQVISLPPGGYVPHLLQSLGFRIPTDFDTVIEDELVHPSLLLAHPGRSISKPVIVSLVHNLRSVERRAPWQNSIYRHFERLYLASVDGYIFNSDVTAAAVTALVGDGKPHVLAHPGGDRLGGLGSAFVRRRASALGPLHLLFLANVIPLKGLHVVLDALKGLPARACTLDVAGSLSVDAAYAARMQRQVQSISTPVKFHGIVDNEPLAELLASSDALVLPSFYEGFGIAYLEGMSFGLPAIGTTAGAIPLMIKDGLNGFLIAPGDSTALRGILQRLSVDRDLLVRLSLGALEYAASRPTWKQTGENIRDFLLGLVETREPAPLMPAG